MLSLLLAACTGPATDSTETAAPVAPPTISWLSPADGESVAIGDVPCSLVIEAFALQDPAKHSEGEAAGYVGVSVDGTELLQVATTTFTLSLEAGAHTLLGQLYYDDGDEITANTERLCEEDDADTTCAAVAASVGVMAE